jgi:polar amino acid transport system substrate-binding protein
MRSVLVAVSLFGVLSAACAPEEPTTPAAGPGGESPTADHCATESLPLLTPGQLTVATDNPAFQPWFGGTGTYGPWKARPNQGTGNPASGEGFESAFVYALAEHLGFTEDQVTWVAVNFNESFAPGPKDFDFDINEISYNENRDQAVDFSDSYYDVAQALVAKKGTPIAEATSFAELQGFQLGAQVGTTSYNYIVENVQPKQQPKVYDRSVDVITALNNGQIDGYVTDAPTAYVNVLIGQVEDGVVVGEFPQIGEQEYFGVVFEEGNTLRDCVNQAIAALREDGTLEALEDPERRFTLGVLWHPEEDEDAPLFAALVDEAQRYRTERRAV